MPSSTSSPRLHRSMPFGRCRRPRLSSLVSPSPSPSFLPSKYRSTSRSAARSPSSSSASRGREARSSVGSACAPTPQVGRRRRPTRRTAALVRSARSRRRSCTATYTFRSSQTASATRSSRSRRRRRACSCTSSRSRSSSPTPRSVRPLSLALSSPSSHLSLPRAVRRRDETSKRCCARAPELTFPNSLYLLADADVILDYAKQHTRSGHNYDNVPTGDRPWNNPGRLPWQKKKAAADEDEEAQKPLLRAVVFDMSSCSNIDTTRCVSSCRRCPREARS